MDTWKIKNKEEDYSISFSDDMIEKCLGQYSRIKKKMLEVEPSATQWVLQTDVNIEHPVGNFGFTLNLYYDGMAVIYNTNTGRMEGHNINDVRF